MSKNRSEYFKEYRKKNKEKNRIYRKKYREENKQQIAEYLKATKEIRAQRKKEYRAANKDKISASGQIYYENNKEEILRKGKQYSKENPEINKKAKQKYRRRKRETDPIFRLRSNVSRHIRWALTKIGSTKNRVSFIKTLPYSLEELKRHVESLFEPWMNWGNQGRYIAKEWSDNDPSTWKWQLDHIIPHSTFHYETMDCEEFRRCWNLSNLRPLSAKQNNLDGGLRTRHNVTE